jgi:hypothetical protein
MPQDFVESGLILAAESEEFPAPVLLSSMLQRLHGLNIISTVDEFDTACSSPSPEED